MSRMFNTSTPLGRTMAALGWTVTDFAAASGVNARTISDYLASRRVMLLEHKNAMADTLGVEVDEIDDGGGGVW